MKERSRSQDRYGRFQPLRSCGQSPPEGMEARLWTKLRVFGAWASTAGHPLGRLSRPVAFTDAGVLTVLVPSSRWAMEIKAHESALKSGLARITGARIVKVEARVDASGAAEASPGELPGHRAGKPGGPVGNQLAVSAGLPWNASGVPGGPIEAQAVPSGGLPMDPVEAPGVRVVDQAGGGLPGAPLGALHGLVPLDEPLPSSEAHPDGRQGTTESVEAALPEILPSLLERLESLRDRYLAAAKRAGR